MPPDPLRAAVSHENRPAMPGIPRHPGPHGDPAVNSPGPQTSSEAAARLRQAVARYRDGHPLSAPALEGIDPRALSDPQDIVNLGVLWRAAGQARRALACYHHAQERGSASAVLWTNMGNALKDLKRPSEACLAHRCAVDLDPGSALAWHNYGIALRGADRQSEAAAALQRAMALSAGDGHNSEWDLALALLAQGRYSEGWPHYHARWKQPGHHHRHPGTPSWDGQPLAPGRRLLLWGEQGFGDVIQCLRFLQRVRPLAAAGSLVVAVAPELIPLAQASLPGIEFLSRDEPAPEFDVQASLLDLPGLLMQGNDDIPGAGGYLRAPPGDNPFSRLLSGKSGCLHVGIVWSGSVTFAANAERALTGRSMLDHLGRPGVQFYALQKGPPQRETAELQRDFGIIDWSSRLRDFGDTAQAVQALDLVIMTDSSVAHLCGALGREVWVLLGQPAHWLWMAGRDDTPWYRSMRFFRQAAPGHWTGALDAAATALAARVRQHAGPSAAG